MRSGDRSRGRTRGRRGRPLVAAASGRRAGSEAPPWAGDDAICLVANLRPPVLSVITPAYNMARYLPYTLDSVAALRTPHEHLVVDGDSDDGTVEMLEGRDDPHLRWISEPDSGQTEAVNKGLRMA